MLLKNEYFMKKILLKIENFFGYIFTKSVPHKGGVVIRNEQPVKSQLDCIHFF